MSERNWRVPYPLWVCVMCPEGSEWVGDYDAGEDPGECPWCHSAVGVFRVDDTFPRPGGALRERVWDVYAERTWDRLHAEDE